MIKKEYIFNKIPEYKPLSKSEERDWIKKLKISFYETADDEEKIKYFNYYCEMFPSFKEKYNNATDIEKEKLLIKAIERGKHYRETFIYNNQKLVYSIASKFIPTYQLEELVQEGNIGIIKALEKFDLDQNVKFSTYATLWIKQTIVRYIQTKASTIKLPVKLHEKMIKLLKYEAILTNELNRTPTDKELESETNIPIETISMIRQYNDFQGKMTSLDTTVSPDNDTEVSELVSSNDTDFTIDIEEEIIKKQLSEAINNIGLNYISKKAIIMRYGLDDEIPKSYEEIAKVIRTTPHGVKTLIYNTLKKIRNNSEIKKILGENQKILKK